jgi:branched-chain amino acid transport system permease protein
LPLQLWVSVIQIGCFFSLVGLGYYVVLNGAGFFNFAIGPYTMFSGLASSWLVFIQGWDLPQAILVGIAATIVLSVLTELLVVRPIERRSGGEELPALIAVVAVLYAVAQLAGTLFGRRPLPGRPWFYFENPIQVGLAYIDAQVIVSVVVTLLVFTALSLWLTFSPYGKIMRAVGDNQEAARTLGFPITRVRVIAFALAGLIAGIAGPLFASKAGVGFESGLSYSLFGFIALVLGGTGSPWAPLAGGMLLATIQIMSSYFFGSVWLNYATLAIAVVFFAIRPEGIFARRVRA